MQKPQMSEPAAWEFLARLWDRPHNDPATAPYVVLARTGKLSRTRMYGLCPCVTGLYQLGRISMQTLKSMLARMKRHKPKELPRVLSLWGYWWPMSMDGARSRAQFCREMAERARASHARANGARNHRPVRLSHSEARLLAQALALWLRTEGLSASSSRLQTARNTLRTLRQRFSVP